MLSASYTLEDISFLPPHVWDLKVHVQHCHHAPARSLPALVFTGFPTSLASPTLAAAAFSACALAYLTTHTAHATCHMPPPTVMTHCGQGLSAILRCPLQLQYGSKLASPALGGSGPSSSMSAQSLNLYWPNPAIHPQPAAGHGLPLYGMGAKPVGSGPAPMPPPLMPLQQLQQMQQMQYLQSMQQLQQVGCFRTLGLEPSPQRPQCCIVSVVCFVGSISCCLHTVDKVLHIA